MGLSEDLKAGLNLGLFSSCETQTNGAFTRNINHFQVYDEDSQTADKV